MKISKLLTLVVITGLLTAVSVNSYACETYSWKYYYNFKFPHHHHSWEKKCPKYNKDNGNTVEAPLDGGLVTILLGSAGVAYFAKRRKKNK